MTRVAVDHPALPARETAVAAGLAQVARIAVTQAAAVQPGERLLVLTDTGGDPRLADLLAAEGRAAGAEVVLASFPEVPTIHDIPARIESVIDGSDVVIPVCRSRILYSDVIKRVSDHGRLLYMADVPTDFFLRPIVLESDYGRLARLAAAFEDVLSVSGRLEVTTPAGTRATMQMDAARGLSISSCRAHRRGDHDYLPGGAWFACPLEETVEGTFVIDSSMEPGVAGGVVDEPVVLQVRAGRVVAVEGGAQADEFTAWLDSCDDQIRGIAHNGGGFNGSAQRIGNLMEDERILGSFNIAGGNNQSGWPGGNSSSSHWDAMMLRATYELDGVRLCEDGRLVHPTLVAAEQGGAAQAGTEQGTA